MYLRYGAPPTAAKWDWKAEVNETSKGLGLVNQSLLREIARLYPRKTYAFFGWCFLKALKIFNWHT
jgi:hypothetical protein